MPPFPASLMIKTSHQRATFATRNERTSTRHCYPKSTVFTGVHPWCRTSGVGQMWNDVSLLLVAHRWLQCPRNPPSPLMPTTTGLFTVSTVLPFSVSCSWNPVVYSLFGLASFLSHIHLKSTSVAQSNTCCRGDHILLIHSPAEGHPWLPRVCLNISFHK